MTSGSFLPCGRDAEPPIADYAMTRFVPAVLLSADAILMRSGAVHWRQWFILSVCTFAGTLGHAAALLLLRRRWGMARVVSGTGVIAGLLVPPMLFAFAPYTSLLAGVDHFERAMLAWPGLAFGLTLAVAGGLGVVRAMRRRRAPSKDSSETGDRWLSDRWRAARAAILVALRVPTGLRTPVHAVRTRK